MAGGSRSGDMVLRTRHLVGLFALFVIVLGVVFTLGYLLGRSRYEGQTQAATTAPAAEPARRATPPPVAPAPVSSDPATPAANQPPPSWDFYKSGEPAKAAELTPLPSPAIVPAASAPIKPVERPVSKAAAPQSRSQTASMPPVPSALIPKGSITLQVAALLHETDALALAQALQEKKFPTIVTTPSADKYYRVQVGPYADSKSANAGLHELEKAGFKPIIRR
jgi:septal ring-binding cell division protein DamX